MNDDGIARGPAFDLINAGHRGGIPGIGGQAINGFRGQRDQLPGAQQFRRSFHRLREQRGGVG